MSENARMSGAPTQGVAKSSRPAASRITELPPSAVDSRGSPSTFNAESFIQLAEHLQSTDDPVVIAERVTTAARDALKADRASITMIRQAGRLETIAATDPTLGHLDQLQYELREGPCYETSWRGELLLCSDLRNDPRWPNWAPNAASLGIASMVAVELASTDRRVGVLNLYFTRSRIFSADEISFLNILGRHSFLAIAHANANLDLTAALASRTSIAQAQGMLMERHNLSEQQAFDTLRNYSSKGNVKLRTVAERVIASRNM